ncbi:MAG: hypothetical protein EOO40_02385 [Deltaproteobacteria bacterium]|nr:MAG: hypothetical protein EOO40_02385 [Deltaproteobacteria bacterium]
MHDPIESASKQSQDTAAKESLIIASKVREIIRGKSCNTAGDALEGLNDWLHLLIDQACKRAQSNRRKTIRAHDFMA